MFGFHLLLSESECENYLKVFLKGKRCSFSLSRGEEGAHFDFLSEEEGAHLMEGE